jgi:hypothetical protein
MGAKQRPRSMIDEIQAHGFTTASMLQRRDWQEEAREAASRHRTGWQTGPITRSASRKQLLRGLATGLGSVLIRMGTRLQRAGCLANEPVP